MTRNSASAFVPCAEGLDLRELATKALRSEPGETFGSLVPYDAGAKGTRASQGVEQTMAGLSPADEERAGRLHEDSVVVDTLAHVLYTVSFFSPNMLRRLAEFSQDVPTHIVCKELARMETDEIVDGSLKDYREMWEKSGVDVASVSLGQYVDVPTDIALWTRKFDSLGWLVKATSMRRIEEAKIEKKRAVILNFQFNPIGNDLGRLDYYYDLGVRIMQLTMNLKNFIGDGCLERTDCGLSRFGVQVVRRMNELGIVVDLTHSGKKTSLDAIETSMKPVILSHATCSSVYETRRSSPDEVLRAVARNNGYCGIMVPPFFLTSRENRPSLNHFFNHLEHGIEVMGIDKVGIGTDWGAHPKPFVARLDRWVLQQGFEEDEEILYDEVTEGFEGWTEWPNFTRGLVSRGYSDEEIRGILGGNFLRVFKEVVG